MTGLPVVNTSSGRTLLLTGTAPGEPGVGGVILQDLLQTVGPDLVTCVWLAPRNAPSPMTIPSLTMHRIVRRYETAWRPVRGSVGELLSLTASVVLRRRMLWQLRNDCLRILESEAFDSVVSVLESRSAIDLSYLMQTQTKLPWRSIVWDDVQLFAQQLALDRWSSAQLVHRFGRVLQRSEDVAVICENMQSAYRDHYGIDSFVLRHGISGKDLPFCDNLQSGNQHGRPFLIGFAGSITAPDCFEQFVRTLDAMQWKVGDRPIVLRILGARYTVHSTVPQRIEYYGWRDTEETNSLLSGCDVNYLPQPFSESQQVLARLSFPTKLTSYVAAGRPILLHAPAEASLSTFLTGSSLGPVIHSLNSLELQNGLMQVAQADFKLLSDWGDAIKRVASEALGWQQFQSGVQRLFVTSRESMER